MKNLVVVSLMGMSLVLGACAHKHGGCADGSCKVEKADKKDCDCDDTKKTEPAKANEKK